MPPPAGWCQVHEDGTNFVRMCEHYNFQLALSSLYEWSIWVTPVIESKRFFTRFYLALLPSLPKHAVHDSLEATTTDWFRPEEGEPLTTIGRRAPSDRTASG